MNLHESSEKKKTQNSPKLSNTLTMSGTPSLNKATAVAPGSENVVLTML